MFPMYIPNLIITVFKSGDNGFTSVSKFKPRSKKIIGKIKMNLKQSHTANDEVRIVFC